MISGRLVVIPMEVAVTSLIITDVVPRALLCSSRDWTSLARGSCLICGQACFVKIALSCVDTFAYNLHHASLKLSVVLRNAAFEVKQQIEASVRQEGPTIAQSKLK